MLLLTIPGAADSRLSCRALPCGGFRSRTPVHSLKPPRQNTAIRRDISADCIVPGGRRLLSLCYFLYFLLLCLLYLTRWQNVAFFVVLPTVSYPVQNFAFSLLFFVVFSTVSYPVAELILTALSPFFFHNKLNCNFKSAKTVLYYPVVNLI